MHFLLSLLFTSSVISQSCVSYQCGSLSNNSCLSYSASNNTSIIQECSKDSFCPFNYSSPKQSLSCQPYPTKSHYPGEPCTSNIDCASGKCASNNTCQGASQNMPCTHTLDCNPGLYCASTTTSSSTTCLPLIPPGKSGCKTSSACSSMSYCNFTGLPETSFCRPSLSLLEGTIINDCHNGINYMCKNLLCTLRGSNFVCASSVTSVNIFPTKCSSDDDCLSIVDYRVGSYYKSQCGCTLSEKPYGVCGLFPGDAPYQKFLAILSLWMNSENITKCNSVRGLSYPCINAYFSYSEVFWYYTFYVFNYSSIQDNEGCVKDTLTNDFWWYEDKMASRNITGAGLGYQVLAVLYLVIIL